MKITSNKHTSKALAVAQNGYLTLAVAGAVLFDSYLKAVDSMISNEIPKALK